MPNCYFSISCVTTPVCEPHKNQAQSIIKTKGATSADLHLWNLERDSNVSTGFIELKMICDPLKSAAG